MCLICQEIPPVAKEFIQWAVRNKALWYCVIRLLSVKLVWMSLLISHLFKQAPEVLGQVVIKAFVTLAVVESLLERRVTEAQNDKLCSYLTVVLMTDGNNHAMLRESF